MLRPRACDFFAAFVVSLLFGVAGAMAQSSVTDLGAKPSADAIIRALERPPGVSRGLVVRNANPATGAAEPAPAAALDIKFALNSATLSDEAKETVRQLATAINSDALGRSRFLLEGHTDTTGTAAYNLALSKRRADAVLDELVKTYGITPARLHALGRGQEGLLDPASPESPTNRRVLIVNLGE